ncbi:MAG: methylated-DNA--[protein]-cysteine S-methyltransferase [Candidatus Omnitrophica bacterium]|nr:methylated-DNA--[protein]-cysteine S-methyltransferase [Candidatus Omnitrophota bacterium]
MKACTAQSVAFKPLVSRMKVDIKTPRGIFRITLSAKGVYRVQFPRKRTWAKKLRISHQRRQETRRFREVLKLYFQGRQVSFSKIKVDWEGYSKFEVRVLKKLRNISWGRTITYQELGRMASSPGSARAVGQALKKNRTPLIIPCHRVVKAGSYLGGFSQGLFWKRRLLRLEKQTRFKS